MFEILEADGSFGSKIGVECEVKRGQIARGQQIARQRLSYVAQYHVACPIYGLNATVIGRHCRLCRLTVDVRSDEQEHQKCHH